MLKIIQLKISPKVILSNIYITSFSSIYFNFGPCSWLSIGTQESLQKVPNKPYTIQISSMDQPYTRQELLYPLYYLSSHQFNFVLKFTSPNKWTLIVIKLLKTLTLKQINHIQHAFMVLFLNYLEKCFQNGTAYKIYMSSNGDLDWFYFHH